MSEHASIRKYVVSSFKLNGLSVRSDACDYFAGQLAPLEENERDEWLEKVIEHIQKQSLSAPFVEKRHIETAILDCCRTASDDNITTFKVISAFEIPHFIYNLDRKKFLPSTRSTYLLDLPTAKCNLFRDRYTILKQRTLRHQLFSSGQQFQLQPVEYLLSSGNKLNRVVILGMLTQLKEGRYYIEDPSGSVPLDLTQASYHSGFFTDSCFVLVEGTYKDKILYVQAVGLPPPESSEISRIYYGSSNIFGGDAQVTLKSSDKLKQIENNNTDAMIIFLSDVWLDRHKVFEKLSVLFSGYDEFPPTAIILMGNFLSEKYGSQHASVLRSKFKILGEIIAQYPGLVANTRFVIIPGPADCLAANILPRPPLLSHITEEFTKRVPNADITTNPCRIQYCTQEIVVIREDLVTKMCRNCMKFPNSEEIPNHFAKTVISQAHLSPLPLSVCPIYWGHDEALRLYPLPDVVVVADQMKSFATTHMDCLLFNPGSFAKGEFAFKVYYPSSKQVEDSQIPDDT